MIASALALASPFFLAKRGLRNGLKAHAGALRGLILDIGCGTKPYRNLFPGNEYLGIEVARESRFGSDREPDAYYDGKHLPIPDQSVESVLCSQVLEHVFEPAEFLAEIHRVLKPGGRLLLTVPFVWDEHEQPFDYARYSSFGLRHLMAKAGFRQLAHERSLGNSAIFVQLWLAYLYKIIKQWPRPIRAAILLAVVLPGNVLGWLIDSLSSSRADLYLDNVALFERTGP